MDAEWEKGFNDAYNACIVGCNVTINATEKGDKMYYIGVGGGCPNQKSFVHRGGMYDRGYGEGLISGFGAYVDKLDMKAECEKLGIIYEK